MPFTVAIVGRPNVGKSTLFNRLAGKRLALVDDRPGLTRDRREVETTLGACTVRLIDTAGLEPGDAGLTARMRKQTEAAIAHADLVLFLIDGRAGVVPADEIFADLVRSAGKAVVLGVNKSEGRAAEPALYEAYALGLGEPLPISAEHDLGIGELAEAIEHVCRKRTGAGDEQGDAPAEASPHPLRIAIVGRPNVGKSTLINALLGEERMITGPEAGITRDAVASSLEWDGRSLLLFDTAGLRRKSRVEERAEALSVGDALKAIRFAEIVVLLVDAEHPFEKQDLQIAHLIAEEGRALVIAVNKWDLVRDREKRLAALRATCQRLLPQVKGVALVPVSALTRTGTRPIDDGDPCRRRSVESQASDARAQSMAASGGRDAPPAGRLGAPHQAQIYHPGECAAADLRLVLLAPEGPAQILFALFGEFLARQFRHAGCADQTASAQGR